MKVQVTCCCAGCAAKNHKYEMIKVELNNRGGSYGYMCPQHINGLADSNTVNLRFRGTERKHGNAVGFDFPCTTDDVYIRGNLSAYGFIPAAGSQSAISYKSPMFYDLSAISVLTKTIEQAVKRGHLTTSDKSTSIHVSCGEQLNNIGVEHLSTLFGLLSGYGIKAELNNSRITFIGFNFVTARQFFATIQFCVAFVSTIITNYVSHYNDQPKDSRRYKTVEAYRAHKSEVTANKLSRLFSQYSDQLITA